MLPVFFLTNFALEICEILRFEIGPVSSCNESNNLDGGSAMKRFMSWLVLLFSFAVVYRFFAAVTALVVFLVGRLADKSIVALIILCLCLGSAILSVFFFVLVKGIKLIIDCSEAICPSRRGIRYLVYSIFNIVVTVIAIFLCIIGSRDFDVSYIFSLIFAVVFLVSSKVYIANRRPE